MRETRPIDRIAGAVGMARSGASRPVLGVVLGCLIAFGAGNAQAQVEPSDPCRGLLFSTSEDFLDLRPRVPDGGATISAGDLLAWHVSTGARLCRRNAELTRAFDIADVDLGLDAVWALDRRRSVIAFSTERDSPDQSRFRAGDLLFTSGGVIPITALLAAFDIPWGFDPGLDAVTLVGEPDSLRHLIERADAGFFREQPGALPAILAELEADIWFSTETAPPGASTPDFVGGDLLSARHGAIVRAHATLSPAPLPDNAARGTDFGLDAFTPALDPIGNAPVELFSTEITDPERAPFAHGDVLRTGPAIWLRNAELLEPFDPVTRDPGVDALHDDMGEFAERAPPSPQDDSPKPDRRAEPPRPFRVMP